MNITTIVVVVNRNFNIKFMKEVNEVTNIEIRDELKKNRMFNYELASMLGISEWTLSRKLRTELPDEEKQHILEIIRGKEEGTNGRAI